MEEVDHRPDLYIGLVCAAGTDLTEIKNQFEAQVSVFKYRRRDVKVSSLISEIENFVGERDEYDRVRGLMQQGDRIRKSTIEYDGVASLIVSGIRNLRGDSDVPSSSLYLIDSLKNPAEVEVLDRIYGRNYYTVSVFVPKEERIENLKNKIAKSKNEPPSSSHEELAKKLIEEDEKGAEKGDQDVQNTFPMADFFINAKEDVKSQIERFVRLVFGEPYATPTPDEYFMFLARASALRSCDLSRQVGAVIADRNGWVVSTGCNEVPLPGGGASMMKRCLPLKITVTKLSSTIPTI